MIELFLNIKINELIASTDSVVEVILNNNVITSLNSEKCSYSDNLILPESKNHLVIRRKYAAGDVRKTGFIKQLISSVICFAVLSCSSIDSFDCLCECQEEFEICFNKDTAKMEINCYQNEDDFYPTFLIKCDECDLSSSKTLFVSDEELKNTCKERRKMMQSLILLMTVVYLLLIVISVVYMKIVTIVFSTLIFSLFLLCFFYSLKNLKKQSSNFKKKFNNHSLPVK